MLQRGSKYSEADIKHALDQVEAKAGSFVELEQLLRDLVPDELKDLPTDAGVFSMDRAARVALMAKRVEAGLSSWSSADVTHMRDSRNAGPKGRRTT